MLKAGVFFQRVEVPCVRGRARSVSKSQAGCWWRQQWRKRDCKIRYWRTGTAYEAYLFWVSNHTLVTPKMVICGQVCRCRSDWRKEKALTGGGLRTRETIIWEVSRGHSSYSKRAGTCQKARKPEVSQRNEGLNVRKFLMRHGFSAMK